MKKCAYCGRDNGDDATQCRECGTREFVMPVEPVAEVAATDSAGLSDSDSPVSLGAGKTIATLDTDMAMKLLSRLKRHGIPAQILACVQDDGLDTSEILVAGADYDRACTVAEAWETELIAEADKTTRFRCPKCQSPNLDPMPHDKLEHVYRCADCGCEIAR